MKSPRLSSRVAAAFVCAAAVLFSSAQSSVSRAQEKLERVARVEAAPYSSPLAAFDDPEAIYEGARVVHNVTVDGEKGMRIHANFRVRYGQGVPCMLIAYFYFDDEDGKPLKAADPKYSTKSGNVYAHVNFTPAYDPAEYKDLQLFVPYSALNMESGDDYDLKFFLSLYDKEGERFFGKSGWYKFHLTMP
jgi:hypothetical protein